MSETVTTTTQVKLVDILENYWLSQKKFMNAPDDTKPQSFFTLLDTEAEKNAVILQITALLQPLSKNPKIPSLNLKNDDVLTRPGSKRSQNQTNSRISPRFHRVPELTNEIGNEDDSEFELDEPTFEVKSQERKRWTAEEDEVLLSALQNKQMNDRETWDHLTSTLGRSLGGVRKRLGLLRKNSKCIVVENGVNHVKSEPRDPNRVKTERKVEIKDRLPDLDVYSSDDDVVSVRSAKHPVRRRWTTEEDDILFEFLIFNNIESKETWIKLERMLPGRSNSAIRCRFKVLMESDESEGEKQQEDVNREVCSDELIIEAFVQMYHLCGCPDEPDYEQFEKTMPGNLSSRECERLFHNLVEKGTIRPLK
jgi:hypothetical protein